MEEQTVMRDMLTDTRTIALVGASDKLHRASYGVMRFLQEKGYRVIPISPRLAGLELLGETVYAQLADVNEPLDMVDLFINSSAAGPITDDAIAAGAKYIWMQLGVINEEAAARAREAGLRVVMDRCPAQEWSRLGMSASA